MQSTGWNAQKSTCRLLEINCDWLNIIITWFLQGTYLLLQCFLMLHIIVRFTITKTKADDIDVMKSIWKIAFLLFISYNALIICHFGLGCHLFKGRSLSFWNSIYEQAQLIQDLFQDGLGVSLCRNRYLVRRQAELILLESVMILA